MASVEIFNFDITVKLPTNLGKPAVTFVKLQRILNHNVSETIDTKEVTSPGKNINFNIQKDIEIRPDGKYAFRIVGVQPIWGTKTWWSENYAIDKATGTLGVDMSRAGKGQTTAQLTTNLVSNYTKLISGKASNDARYYCDRVYIRHKGVSRRRVNNNVSSAGACADLCSSDTKCNFMQYSNKQCILYMNAALDKLKVMRYASVDTSNLLPSACYVNNDFYKQLTTDSCTGDYKTTTLGCAPGWTFGKFKGCETHCGQITKNDAQNVWTCKYCGCNCQSTSAHFYKGQTAEQQVETAIGIFGRNYFNDQLPPLNTERAIHIKKMYDKHKHNENATRFQLSRIVAHMLQKDIPQSDEKRNPKLKEVVDYIEQHRVM